MGWNEIKNKIHAVLLMVVIIGLHQYGVAYHVMHTILLSFIFMMLYEHMETKKTKN